MGLGENDRFNKEIKKLREELRRKENEIKDLKLSNVFLETLFNGIDEDIMVIDADFNVQDVNEVFLERYHVNKEDIIGKKCHEIIYGEDKPCSSSNQICPLKQAMETGKMVEVTHVRNEENGESKELMRIMYPLVTDESTPKHFIEISREITEYRTLIKKLQTSEKKFKAILDTATDAILSIDKKNRIILFNNAAQRIFGYKSNEVLGKNLNMLVPLQYGDHSRYVERFLEEKAPKLIGKTISLTAVRKGGEIFPIELGLSYMDMGDEVTFTAIIRDVSQQKHLEKKLLQSERLAAVGEAVAHVAHEIRNPLMIIGGFSHQIAKSLEDEKATQKVNMIFDEVKRLEKLVENLGDLTKEYNLVKRPADINSVIRDVLKIMAELYSPEKYRFKEHLEKNLEEINCDPDKLKQVFMNIISNGVEALEGGGTISVQTKQIENGAEIHINDEGVGMDEESLLHIFEPFYTTRKRGSGLGLSISYKIVEAHKGEIWADSKPGEGTTFSIRLPSS